MSADRDVELCRVPSSHLANDCVTAVSWSKLQVVVKDRASKQPMAILSDSVGVVRAGEMLAIMGPSGSGKTTLLNTLAHRKAAAGASSTGGTMVDGRPVDTSTLRNLSAYVEQEDVLIGSLTVRETMVFAARLALPSNVSKKEALQRVDDLIASFGLQSRADTIVGTPIKKGLSGGQKRRLGVASRLVTNPKILFLDEPTSGLDSTLSHEVMKYIKDIARENALVVIVSIHQPSTSTYQLFDKLCLVSGGKTCYFGPVDDAPGYFARSGHPVPSMTNPAEFFLDLVNTDLDKNGEVAERARSITEAWASSPQRRALESQIDSLKKDATETRLDKKRDENDIRLLPEPSPLRTPFTLLHRSWIKSRRDVVVYGIRVAMYLGLAVMMGTVFLRLGPEQKYIQPYTNAIFFGGAFMSFMAVAYVPAFLEDLHTYRKERADGLAGPLSFLVANFTIGIPYLFLIALLFSVVSYWLGGFRADGGAFMTWVLWLFLDLLAAESLVVLVSCVFPVFVVSLAVTAFANGLWMCVGGFLVPMGILNVFWKYVFHYIDYQAYVFKGMMVNEFEHRTYECDALSDGSFSCMYPSRLNAEGKIDGAAVLNALSIGTGNEGTWLGIMVGIIAGYRVLAYLALRFLAR